MLTTEEAPQEILEAVQQATSDMTSEERTTLIVKQMTSDCAAMYSARMKTGKMTMRDQAVIRDSFINRYPTENLRKIAEIVHDKYKEQMATASAQFLDEKLHRFWMKVRYPFLIGIVVIFSLVIYFEVAPLI